MTDANGGESFSLDWDLNGNMKTGVTTTLTYNWDSKLRSAVDGNDSIDLKYEPLGNRIWRQSIVSGQTTTRRYIVDIVGNLPVILLEIDADTNSVEKKYVYANAQVIMQYDANDDRFFYLHDRLGSVRLLINADANVVNRYTYNPFGELYSAETEETVANPFKFTGQYFDSEIDQYYLRARQYNPHIGRFTSRDPMQVQGKFRDPLSLHKYLYCENDPINRIDPWGLLYLLPGAGHSYSWEETQQVINAATEMVGTHFYYGPLKAFGRLGKFGIGEFDYKMHNKLYGGRLDFRLKSGERLLDSEFGNYLAGYTTFYNYRLPGIFGSWMGGHYYGVAEWYQYRTGVSKRYVRWVMDDFGSQYWQARGCLDASRDAYSGLRAQLERIIIGAAVWNLDILRHLDYYQYSKDSLSWQDLNIWN